MEPTGVARLVSEYQRALRCWRCNNLKASLIICAELARDLEPLEATPQTQQLKQLTWFLQIRCLADDFYLNESLLLDELDLDNDEQVRVFSRANKQSRQATSRPPADLSARNRTATGRGTSVDVRRRTGTLTGRRPSGLSRGNSRTSTSYRPLTTSLAANQTAFSRTTRPLLKYATSAHLSKPFFEYLYNAQTVNNKCPDYRQCLEYISLVTKSSKSRKIDQNAPSAELVSLAAEHDDHLMQDVFWLLASGACYFHLNMYGRAEEHFIKATELNAGHLDAYTWLVKVYLRSNQPAKVLKICDEGLRHCKSDILYNWKARAQSMFADLHGANLSLRDSLAHFPTNLEALANVSHFAFYEDKLELALKGFQRILHLSANRSTSIDGLQSINGSLSQLFNNLALCNLYCGYYHRVMSLFQRALQSSPDKETTSDIWYNISFVPISCGLTNLAVACLRLACRNNSQNEEAINNLGVLRYAHLVDDSGPHFENRQEFWASTPRKSTAGGSTESDLINHEDIAQHKALMDEVEVYFSASSNLEDDGWPPEQPEMLYNMAIVKMRRGQLMAAARYCNLYLTQDQNNYQIKSMLNEIRQLVCHDA